MAHKFLSLFLVACLAAAPAWAEKLELSADKEAIAEDIFVSTLSPFCAARSLQDCPSGNASELKDKIRADLAAGKSRDEIMQQLFATYGEKIRSVPAARGFGLVGWLAPLGFLLLGGVVLLVWVRLKTSASGVVDAKGSSSIDPAMQKRIDEELAKF